MLDVVTKPVTSAKLLDLLTFAHWPEGHPTGRGYETAAVRSCPHGFVS